jgi:hypothetical protein
MDRMAMRHPKAIPAVAHFLHSAITKHMIMHIHSPVELSCTFT